MPSPMSAGHTQQLELNSLSNVSFNGTEGADNRVTEVDTVDLSELSSFHSMIDVLYFALHVPLAAWV
jgi:hypothetical protein